MALIRHELRQNFITYSVWTMAITFFMVVCIFMFPEMKTQMNEIGDVFASMGTFTQAFGMDRLNFGTLIGFYGVECGNVLGIGGAFFASMIAISAVSKEEKDGTAEFLLTHPISRLNIYLNKGIAILIQLVVLNVVVWVSCIISILIIGEDVPWMEINLMHLAYFLLQIEIAGICFGISTFLRKGSLGVGLGIAIVLYFFNLISNISESADFLNYITPFSYTEGADIVSNGKIDVTLVIIGIAYAIISVTIGCFNYRKKDIH